MIKFSVYFTVLVILSSCQSNERVVVKDEYKKFYDNYNLEGSFALFDANSNETVLVNESQFHQEFSPASTFKICNSLIGIETQVIKDKNFVIKWDSTKHSRPAWNQDQTLQMAYKNSTVWYYQELARRVGKEKMNYWLKKSLYGNMDTAGGIDKFWLSGALRITPSQQIDFLKRLNNYELPFKKESINEVKQIMIAKDTLGCLIRAKTGWNDNDSAMVGWYVGYIEKGNKTYYFVNCVQTKNKNHEKFAEARINITYQILEELKILK